MQAITWVHAGFSVKVWSCEVAYLRQKTASPSADEGVGRATVKCARDADREPKFHLSKVLSSSIPELDHN